MFLWCLWEAPQLYSISPLLALGSHNEALVPPSIPIGWCSWNVLQADEEQKLRSLLSAIDSGRKA